MTTAKRYFEVSQVNPFSHAPHAKVDSKSWVERRHLDGAGFAVWPPHGRLGRLGVLLAERSFPELGLTSSKTPKLAVKTPFFGFARA